MEDRGPETKLEEQYPLLKVDSGGDNPPTQTVLTPGYGMLYSKKTTWVSRWPELMSACWMTMILIGMLFLIFYTLGMSAYIRQKFLVKCNTSTPATNVFYHHLVQRGSEVPFLRHSQYLANMAEQYPNLRFNIFFLIDGSCTLHGRRANRLVNNMFPYYPYGSSSYTMDENYQQSLDEFQRKYQNVNVTVIPLCKYMARTPLRYKWRAMENSYLPFYCRTFSVWENGGIGIDLALQTVDEDSLVSRRMSAILKQHNDGIDPEAYANALNTIDKEEKMAALNTIDVESTMAMLNVMFGAMNSFLDRTRSFINRTISFSEPKPDVLIQTNRSKRHVPNGNKSVIETTTLSEILNSSIADAEQKDNTNAKLDRPLVPRLELLKNIFKVWPNATTDSELNITNAPQVVLVYDFQLLSDNIRPPFNISESLISSDLGQVVKRSEGKHVKRSSASHMLSIDAEGTFVAASSRLHPLLGRIITAGFQRMSPRCAVQNALFTQCSGLTQEDDVYCNNIYIL